MTSFPALHGTARWQLALICEIQATDRDTDVTATIDNAEERWWNLADSNLLIQHRLSPIVLLAAS